MQVHTPTGGSEGAYKISKRFPETVILNQRKHQPNYVFSELLQKFLLHIFSNAGVLTVHILVMSTIV